MSKIIEITVRFEIVERPAGKRGYGTAETLRDDLEQYLTSREAPLRADYGSGAWGGYEGAYITAAEVTKSAITEA